MEPIRISFFGQLLDRLNAEKPEFFKIVQTVFALISGVFTALVGYQEYLSRFEHQVPPNWLAPVTYILGAILMYGGYKIPDLTIKTAETPPLVVGGEPKKPVNDVDQIHTMLDFITKQQELIMERLTVIEHDKQQASGVIRSTTNPTQP